MRRLSVLVLSVFVLLVLTGSAALAGVKWCLVDPVVTVNGRSVNLGVNLPELYLGTVTGAVEFEVHVPRGSSVQVEYLPAPLPERVRVVYDLPQLDDDDDDDDGAQAIPMVVRASLRATATFPTLTTAIGTNVRGQTSAAGRSNRVTTLKLWLY